MAILNLISLSFALTALSSVAAPPVDLTQLEERKKTNQQKPIKEADLIFADPVAVQEEKVTTRTRKIETDVVARKGPRDNAPAMFKLKAGEYVHVVKVSNDRKWTIIQVISTRRRAWVPVKVLSAPLKANPNSENKEEVEN